MYCSTCGAFVPAGRTACTECGTQVALPARRQQSAVPRYGSEDRRWVAEPLVGQCPRCGYHGEGLPYFSRGLHVALLVGATVATAGMMGMGGLIYYLVRRDHRACPRCGRNWGRQGEYSLAPLRAVGGATSVPEVPIPHREFAKRRGSIFLFVMAAILMIVGIASLELAPVLFALLTGTGGWFLHRAALDEREARRAALIASLQQPVLKLAGERKGRLTVTEVATQMGWSLPRAEKVLESLNDGLRVDSEVTDEGVIVYEFRELLSAPDRLPETDRLPESSG